MSVHVQNKLLNYEMPPPEGIWKKITQRLDQEFDKSEIKLSQKIYDAILLPPSNAWEEINRKLDNNNAEENSGRVIPFNWKRMAIAASVIGIIGFGIFYYSTSQDSSNASQIAQEAQTVTNSDKPTDIAGKVSDNTIDGKNLIANNIPQIATLFIPKRAAANLVSSSSVALISNKDFFLDSEVQFVKKETFKTVDVTEKAIVSAPLIRDEDGKVIMDMNLLTTNASSYIAVTGPNGQQTRISIKFANVLSALNNSGVEKEEYIDFLIRQSTSWKKRFEEWRTKILQFGTFAPSGATFFDILELKELLKD